MQHDGLTLPVRKSAERRNPRFLVPGPGTCMRGTVRTRHDMRRVAAAGGPVKVDGPRPVQDRPIQVGAHLFRITQAPPGALQGGKRIRTTASAAAVSPSSKSTASRTIMP